MTKARLSADFAEVPGFCWDAAVAPDLLVRYVREGQKRAEGEFPVPDGATHYFVGGNFLDFRSSPVKGSYPLDGERSVRAWV